MILSEEIIHQIIYFTAMYLWNNEVRKEISHPKPAVVAGVGELSGKSIFSLITTHAVKTKLPH